MRWFDWHTVTDRLEGRCVALTEGLPYKVKLSPHIDTAGCDHTTRSLIINPLAFDNLITTKSQELRDKTNYLVTRALMGHEVMHVLYTHSGWATSDPVVNDLTNILEDARVEGIGSYDNYVNRALFGLIAKLCGKTQPEFTDLGMADNSSWVKLMLRWRFKLDMPFLDTPVLRMKLETLLDMCNNALYAVDVFEVQAIAKKITEDYNLKQPDTSKAMNKNISTPNEKTTLGKSDETRNNPRDKQKEEEKEKQQQEAQSQPQEQAQPQEQPSQEGTGTPQAAENGAPNPEPQPSETPKQSPTPETSPSQGQEQSTAKGGGGNGAGNEEPNEELELADLVGNLQRKLGEDVSNSLKELEALNKDATIRPEDAGSRIPYWQNVTQQPYIDLLKEARPLAKKIVGELKLTTPNTNQVADRYSGRFKLRYHIRDEAKPFAKKKMMGKAIPPMAISLLVDRSSSMEDSEHELKLMTMVIVLACEELNIPLDIRIFTGNNHIKRFDEWGPKIYARIAGIVVDGGTKLGPCLESVTKELLARPEPLKQVVMVHDGAPFDMSVVVPWFKEKKNPDVFAIYVLPKKLKEHQLAYEKDKATTALSRFMEPQNFTIAPIDKAPSRWCTYMKAYRDHFQKCLS